MSNSPRNVTNRLECYICQRAFTRNEHLKRHELTHTKRRQFTCNNCGKGFLRKDALNRHQATHQITGPTLVEKGGRACTNCASAKVRCSGETPVCSRCQTRPSLVCQYPAIHSAQTAPLDEPVANSPDVQNETLGPTPMANAQSITYSEQSQLNLTGQLARVAPVSLQTPNNDVSFSDWNAQSTINWLSNDDFAYLDGFDVNGVDNDFFFPTAINSNPLYQQGTPLHHQPISPTESVPPHVMPSNDNLNSRHHVNIASVSSATPHSSVNSAQEDHVEGEFYVDGQPARLPRVKRRKFTISTPTTTRSDDARTPFRLDGLNSTYSAHLGRYQISNPVYEEICAAFILVKQTVEADLAQAGTDTSVDNMSYSCSPKFAPQFVSKGVLERLLDSYVDAFDGLLPILHVNAFQALEWQLILATASIGARMMAEEEAMQFAESLDEFVRKLLYRGERDASLLPSSVVSRTQLQLLHLIASKYSRISRSSSADFILMQSLIRYCNTEWVQPELSTIAMNVEQSWEHWKSIETRRRTGYSIWMLDCMLSIHFQQRTYLTLSDAQPPLPCCEELWQARDAQSWHNLTAKYHQTQSMQQTLQSLYVEKELPHDFSEFSRILLIHGLFRRMSETESYLADPLNHWEPSAHKQLESSTLSRSDIWIPSLPIFAKWRNSTCDCLDVLHWSANATIGLASGIEHPTVMHLHFARVVLLTPHSHIVAFAKHIVCGDNTPPDSRAIHHQTIIRKWAVQDQYKARLAMIHAGVLFWHVRRYSSHAFYEPASVALATLALWAFCTFSPRQRPGDSGPDEQPRSDHERGARSESEDSFYEIILLDRPTDDELVQQFVREGHKMRANMNGVGDLYSEGAPRKVLVEGRKLLRTIPFWKSCHKWITLMDQLIDISRSSVT